MMDLEDLLNGLDGFLLLFLIFFIFFGGSDANLSWNILLFRCLSIILLAVIFLIHLDVNIFLLFELIFSNFNSGLLMGIFVFALLVISFSFLFTSLGISNFAFLFSVLLLSSSEEVIAIRVDLLGQRVLFFVVLSGLHACDRVIGPALVVFVVVAVLLGLISIVVIFINVFVHHETVLDIHHLLVFIFVVLLLQVIVLLLWWDNAFEIVIFVFRPLVLVDNILSDHLMLQVVFTNDLLVLLIDHASFTFFFSVAFEVVIVHAGLGGVVVLVLVNDGLLLFAFTFAFLSLLPHLLLFSSLLLLLQE